MGKRLIRLKEKFGNFYNVIRGEDSKKVLSQAMDLGRSGLEAYWAVKSKKPLSIISSSNRLVDSIEDSIKLFNQLKETVEYKEENQYDENIQKLIKEYFYKECGDCTMVSCRSSSKRSFFLNILQGMFTYNCSLNPENCSMDVLTTKEDWGDYNKFSHHCMKVNLPNGASIYSMVPSMNVTYQPNMEEVLNKVIRDIMWSDIYSSEEIDTGISEILMEEFKGVKFFTLNFSSTDKKQKLSEKIGTLENYDKFEFVDYDNTGSRVKSLLELYKKSGIAHSILLSGAPGIGKSTIAKFASVGRTLVLEFNEFQKIGERDINIWIDIAKVETIIINDFEKLSKNDQDANLEIIDNLRSSGSKVFFIFTCNNEEELTPSLARPGRIDQVIRMKELSLESRKLVFEYYINVVFRSKYDKEELSFLIENSQGLTSAYIKELAKRYVNLGFEEAKEGISELLITMNMRRVTSFSLDRVNENAISNC